MDEGYLGRGHRGVDRSVRPGLHPAGALLRRQRPGSRVLAAPGDYRRRDPEDVAENPAEHPRRIARKDYPDRRGFRPEVPARPRSPRAWRDRADQGAECLRGVSGDDTRGKALPEPDL